MSSKQAKRRRAEEARTRPPQDARAERSLPAWVVPVLVLLAALAVIALALFASQQKTR
jgi:hypothetical protein